MSQPRQPFSIHPVGRAILTCSLLAEFLLLIASSCALCGMKLEWFPTEHYVFWKKLHLIAGVGFAILAAGHLLANIRMLMRHLKGVRGVVAVSVMMVLMMGTLVAAFYLSRPPAPIDDEPATKASTYATPEE
jgi:hypothetical protein